MTDTGQHAQPERDRTAVEVVVPGTNNRRFLSDFHPETQAADREAYLDKHAGFITHVSEVTFRHPETFTPRTPEEIRFLLEIGQGELTENADGEAVAIMLTPELFPREVQAMFLRQLGYTPDQIASGNHFFNIPVKELSASYVHPDHRKMGHYEATKKRTMWRLENEHPEAEKSLVISSNTNLIAPAKTAPENGMAPLPFDEFPVLATFVSFIPDEVFTVKPIPEDYDDIAWRDSAGMQRLVRALVNRVSGDPYALEHMTAEEPIVYVRFDSGYAVGRTLSKPEIPAASKMAIYLELATTLTGDIRYLERHLQQVIEDSPNFQMVLGNPDYAGEEHFAYWNAKRQEYMARAMDRIERVPVVQGSYNTMATKGYEARVQALMMQQYLVDVLRGVNDECFEARPTRIEELRAAPKQRE